MSTNVVVYDEIDANFEIFMVILYEDVFTYTLYINRIKVYLKVGRPACNQVANSRPKSVILGTNS